MQLAIKLFATTHFRNFLSRNRANISAGQSWHLGTNREYTDIFLVVGGNAFAAPRLFSEQYPNSYHPDRHKSKYENFIEESRCNTLYENPATKTTSKTCKKFLSTHSSSLLIRIINILIPVKSNPLHQQMNLFSISIITDTRNYHSYFVYRVEKREIEMGIEFGNRKIRFFSLSTFSLYVSQEDSKPRKDAGPAIVVHGLSDPADNSSGQVITSKEQKILINQNIRRIKRVFNQSQSHDGNDRRVPYSIPADWKALWFSNLDDLQRVNDANDNNTVSNVTVQLGGTAFLHCKVRNLADRTVSDAEVNTCSCKRNKSFVSSRARKLMARSCACPQISWIRRRDFHVLTSSTFTYTNDERFQVLHPEGSDDWTLQIKYVQDRDNGTYECQYASTMFIDESDNSSFSITGLEEYRDIIALCQSKHSYTRSSPTPPQYVFWYHNNRMINYDTTRGSSVTVQTDSSSTQSRLTIHQAVESDTGNYTCSASNTKPASIYVFVTEESLANVFEKT
ncbi:Hemicentin-1 [Apis cerana cerana]|uniref:Hemicentin-1 n=1 Tax=Apis cerana cerana TaxID=94128 RepID=A0A2A3EGT1_APICC|nr:Hemicentin-1 [Apis cerana cerana]